MKRMAILFAVLLFISMPSVSALENVEQHYTTDYEIHTYGTYIDGIDNMLVVDGNYARFNETKHNITGNATDFVIDTESITNWTAETGISSLSADTERVLLGTYSIKGVTADKNDIEFRYNGDLDWDLGNVNNYNLSINCDAATVLVELRLCYSDAIYWSHAPSLSLVKNTWNNISLYIADFDPVGGMSVDHHINHLEFHFTQTAANKRIWLDDIRLIGKKAGSIERRCSFDMTFDGLPHKDNYEATLVARYVSGLLY
ncbi:MAG: hypothetical protein ACTSPB_20635, partial [Candidatus Thorarchaeota archaeon]